MNVTENFEQFVFGLDIGTRNVVGTVGYLEDGKFNVIAQYTKEHDTRAMLDGQIHDINRVGKTIETVKKHLEDQIESELSEVCIAAAGRVLKTVTTKVEMSFNEETVVNKEHIHSLDLLGVEKAQEELKKINDTKFQFYCVGYTVIKYFLNDDIITNLESHKAEKIGEEIIVTFLPEDVVDGLYAAVGMAGLEVSNLTLEPIAAINVAIPETYRMLNIALVDVGAGTSDICITKEGSIIAYGMIPHAGDEITELIVQHYLVDFKMAEHIKVSAEKGETIKYTDIMALEHEIDAQEVWKITEPMVEKIASEVSNKIIELNGDKSVSAVFVVGGGGKIHEFTAHVAKELNLPPERVALRGEEVLKEVVFLQEEVKKDPLLVTPIGICLNYYEHKNNFIFVQFNGERIKLFNNNKLSIVDAALQADFPYEYLFPRRGKELKFVVNGKTRMVRGEQGESSVIKMNGKPASVNTMLEPNCQVEIISSTAGEEAQIDIKGLEEYNKSISFKVNGKVIECPVFASVNGKLESPYYFVKEGDEIEFYKYYTVQQIMEFMDIPTYLEYDILVNNKPVSMQERVYENFFVEWTFKNAETDGPFVQEEIIEEEVSVEENENISVESTEIVKESEGLLEKEGTHAAESEKTDETVEKQEIKQEESNNEEESVDVIVNGEPIHMNGKEFFVYVDVFDYINFNLNESNGRIIVTQLNGKDTSFTEQLKTGDKVDIYWKEK